MPTFTLPRASYDVLQTKCDRLNDLFGLPRATRVRRRNHKGSFYVDRKSPSHADGWQKISLPDYVYYLCRIKDDEGAAVYTTDPLTARELLLLLTGMIDGIERERRRIRDHLDVK